jgi:hypothetical protein
MSLVETHSDIEINFDAAEMFLREARQAHEQGDKIKCLAARMMVTVALHLSAGAPVDIRTNHLKS